MARDTRAAAASASAHAAEAPSAPAGQKRKRRSPPPSGVSGRQSPVRLVLPSAASLKSSPTKPNGEEGAEGEHDTKRQRVSLKLKVNGANGTAAPQESAALEEEAVGEEDAVEDAEDEGAGSEKQALAAPALNPEVRAALATVIAQMSAGLPAPLNNILALGLPPDFADKEENTLGYLLRRPSLTWASLVNTLHLFAENLLIPTAYPNPMPSLARFHVPLPALPSQYPPNPIYNFCERLHDLMRQLEPEANFGSGSEQWALVQRLPASTSREAIGGEWFTSSVDPRRIEAGLQQVKVEAEEQPLLASLAGKGDSFGYATPLSLQTAIGSSSKPSQKLSDSMLKRASLKAKQWKEQLRAKRGGFGDVFRPVLVPPVTSFSFTPTFGPFYDSAYSSGPVGYYDTLDAMHERQRSRAWTTKVEDAAAVPVAHGYKGMEDAEAEVAGQGRTVQEVLEENGKLITELQSWQEWRVAKNQSEPTEREQLVAAQLLDSLASLAGSLTPAELLAKGMPDAHELAKRFLPVSSPSVRGILDPRRPKALHDNTTVRMRPAAYAPSGAASPGISTQLAGGGTQMHSSSSSTLPRAGTYPAQSPGMQPYARGSPPAGQTAYAAPTYSHYGPSTAYRPPTPLGPPSAGTGYARIPPGPGPSALRQSFGPAQGAGGRPVLPGTGGGTPGVYGAGARYGLPPQSVGGTQARV